MHTGTSGIVFGASSTLVHEKVENGRSRAYPLLVQLANSLGYGCRRMPGIWQRFC